MTLPVAALVGCTSALSTAPQPTAPSTGSAQPTEAATDEAAVQQGFARWVTSFRATARAAGIDDATLQVAFDDVHYLPRVVELDRAQPEFTRTIWDYLDSAVTPQRVALGREKLLQVRGEADAAAAVSDRRNQATSESA